VIYSGSSKDKCKVTPALDLISFHEDVRVSGDTAPRILNFGRRWDWMVSFTPRGLLHRR